MAEVTYEKDITGLVVIDPYNDFISEGGKVWDRLKGVAEANGCIPHMKQVLDAARRGRHPGLLRAASPIPARRLRDVEVHRADSESGLGPQDVRVRHVGRRAPHRVRAAAGRRRGPRALVLKRVRQHRSGPAAQEARRSTSSSSSGSSRTPAWRRRSAIAAELGYQVTVVKDATASYSDEEMHAALDINIPNYATAVVTTAN